MKGLKRQFKDRWVVSSGQLDNTIIIACENAEGKEIFRMDSSVLNSQSLNHKFHLVISKATGEIVIREVLSDLTVPGPQAVTAELTLIGGTFDVTHIGPSLAKGALEALFLRLKLRSNGSLGKQSISGDVFRWEISVQEQLCFHKYRPLLKWVQLFKIWVVNPSNIDGILPIMRTAFQRGGSLPSDFQYSSRFQFGGKEKRYLDWDGGLGTYLPVPPMVYDKDYKTKEAMVDHFEQTISDPDGQITRIKHLEMELKLSKEEVVVARAQCRDVQILNAAHVESLQRLKDQVLPLRLKVYKSKVEIEKLNREHAGRCQVDISALATELALSKGISRGDVEGIKTRLPSMIVGQSTVDHLLLNTIFRTEFLEQSNKRSVYNLEGADSPYEENGMIGMPVENHEKVLVCSPQYGILKKLAIYNVLRELG